MDRINDFSKSFSSPSTPSGQQFFITFNDNSSNNSNSIPKNNVPRNNDVPKNNVQSKLIKFFSLMNLMNF